MRRALWFVLVFAGGVVAGWLGAAKPAAQPGVDHGGDIFVSRQYKADPLAGTFVPHGHCIDGKTTKLFEPEDGDLSNRWVISMHGGRVQYFCTRVAR
jgi:hypothetical protein